MLKLKRTRTQQPIADVGANKRFRIKHLWGGLGAGTILLDATGRAHGTIGQGSGVLGGTFAVNQFQRHIILSDSGTGTTLSKWITLGVGNSGGLPDGPFSLLFSFSAPSVGVFGIYGQDSFGNMVIRTNASGFIEVVKASVAVVATSAVAYAANTYYDVAVTYDKKEFRFFLNGSNAGVTSYADLTWSNTAQAYLTGPGPANGSRVYRAAVLTEALSNPLAFVRNGFWQLYEDDVRYVSYGAEAAAATYTMTSAGYVPGSLTATSVVPRIVRTKA